MCTCNICLDLIAENYFGKNLLKYDLRYVQEHWLLPSILDEFANINSDLVYYAVSHISNNDSLLLGWSYGGLAVLWKKELSSIV